MSLRVERLQLCPVALFNCKVRALTAQKVEYSGEKFRISVDKNVVVVIALSLEFVTDEARKKALPRSIERLTRCGKNSPTYIEIDDLAMLHRRLLRVRVLVCYMYN